MKNCFMNKRATRAVRQVLNEAGNSPHFFDLSDGERLNWMIARAFALGSQSKSVNANTYKGQHYERWKS